MNTPDGAERAILDLLEVRGARKTICPSEAARALVGAKGDWRAQMARVHQATDALNKAGAVQLPGKGEEIDQRCGAYRIARR
ncbi:MAG: DUF3253 domain-containing protein [Pseudomonadota bacterium]